MSPIAVVGLGSILPGSRTVGGYWRDIVLRRERLTDVPPKHWLTADFLHATPGTPDKVYAAKGGFIPEVDFAPLDFGLPPNAVPATDTAQLLALIVAREVLNEATQGRLADIPRDRISVILGVASATELMAHMSRRLAIPTVERALRQASLDETTVLRVRQTLERSYVPWQESTFPGLLANVVAGRIANRFDLGGSNYVVDAACAGSLAALAAGVNELHSGDADLVLSGGVDTLNDILMFMCFAQVGALSASGRCRPFSADADGTMLGEGVCLLALKRLADAEREGDPIYAVIRGIGSSSDGRAKSIYAPLPAGQALAMKRAYARAAYGPETVGLVECHGTATRAGDLAELESTASAFAGAATGRCAIGSVKSQIGHTKATAGAAGLAKAVLALHHKVLPATLGVERPTPAFDFEQSPFFINTETRPWLHGPDAPHPRRAAVSSFGFGGTNFHITLEEYQGEPQPLRLRAVPAELILLSESTPAELSASCRRLVDSFSRSKEGVEHLSHAAFASQRAFDSRAQARLAVVARSAPELVKALSDAATRLATAAPGATWTTPEGSSVALAAVASPPPIAFLFPGQGSQYVGMAGDLAVHVEAVRRVLDRLATRAFAGEPLSARLFPAPAFDTATRARNFARLTATEWAQPALAAASLGFLAFARALGLTASAALGHSLGELTALCAAGVLDDEALLRVARARGELLAAVPETGAMMALACSLEEASRLVGDAQGEVVIANHNAPRQLVISGRALAVQVVGERAKASGIPITPLAVSTAFHSPLVAGAAPALRALLEDIELRSPSIPVIGNTDAEPYSDEPARIRGRLAAQLAAPVRFVDGVERLYADGVRVFVELGPGDVLARLTDGILGERSHLALSFDKRPASVTEGSDAPDGYVIALKGLARLAVAGVPLALDALWAREAAPADPLTEPRSKLVLAIDGSNYGKPPAPDSKPASPSAAPSVAATTSTPSSEPRRAPPQPVPLELAQPPALAVAPGQAGLYAPLIQAQLEFQRLMSDSHMTFLRTLEASFAQAGAGGAPPPPSSALATRAEPLAAPPAASAEPRVELVAAPLAATHAALGSAATGKHAEPDLLALMVAVVAEKTGYPPDMLELGMDLESDLGIDSIKRVEILSTLRERAPGLPELDPSALGKLRTLQQIVDFLSANRAVFSAGAGPAERRTLPRDPAPKANTPPELLPLMVAVVAEKTGYPADMLELGMDLESDLGIDSIKRVEILSALRERAPGLPELDPSALGKLRTLQQIVDFLQTSLRPVKVVPDEPRSSPSGADGSADAARVAEPLRFFVPDELPRPPTGLAMGGLFAGPVLVTPPSPLALALAARLVAAGVAAHTDDSELDRASGVVFVAGARSDVTIDDAIAIEREAFGVARRLAPRFREQGGLFATVRDLSGPHALERSFLAGLSALAKSAQCEWPRVAVKAIDLPRAGRNDDELARILAEELLGGGPELEVLLPVRGPRFVRSLREVSAPARTQPASGVDDVVAVSGGARGVTAAIVIALARRRRTKFVLLGRTPLRDESPRWSTALDEAALKRVLLEEARAEGQALAPRELGARVEQILAGREIAGTLAAIRAAGGDALYVPCDIRDVGEVAAALAEGRARFGPITGVIHGAGVIADARLEHKTDAQFARVFETKVQGLRALLRATASDDLRMLALISSIAAHLGNAGQADYAMANEVLNQVALEEAARRGSACRVVALGYGPWQGGMVSPALQRHFKERGVGLIPLDAGAEASVDALLADWAPSPTLVLAAGASLGAEVRRTTADVMVDASRSPQLEDHRVQGVVVIPVALAIEWMARCSRIGASPGTRFHLREFHVDRGVTLRDFETPARLHIVGEPRIDETAFEIRDAAGGRRFRGLASESAHLASAARASSRLSNPGSALAGPYYSAHRLFHGPRFQVIQRYASVARDGARASIVGMPHLAWPRDPWALDVAALDGALQTGVLWFLEISGCQSLPLAIAEVIVHRPGCLPDGVLEVELLARSIANERAVCDLSVRDEDDRELLTLSGVELFALPSAARSSGARGARDD